MVLVHGVSKFNEIVRNSLLPTSDPRYKPVHFDKKFKLYDRKLRKILSKSGWYSSEGGGKSNWRTSLPTEWRGSKPMQRKIPDLDYSTVMQVPSTADGRLLKGLARIEPRLAKISGYQCKLIEKGGMPLSRMFSKDFSSGKCSRNDCNVCCNPNLKGNTMCKVSDVVYEAVCESCEKLYRQDESKPHLGKNVGESYRTLYERSGEHFKALRRFDHNSFMVKHWANVHFDQNSAPIFHFKVVKKHFEPLSRKVHEAVRIASLASMNSKSEWGGFKLNRLAVEISEYERLKDIAADEAATKAEGETIESLKNRVQNLGTNVSSSCRKRKGTMVSVTGSDQGCSDAELGAKPKKRTCVTTSTTEPAPVPANPRKSKKGMAATTKKKNPSVAAWLKTLQAPPAP